MIEHNFWSHSTRHRLYTSPLHLKSKNSARCRRRFHEIIQQTLSRTIGLSTVARAAICQLSVGVEHLLRRVIKLARWGAQSAPTLPSQSQSLCSQGRSHRRFLQAHRHRAEMTADEFISCKRSPCFPTLSTLYYHGGYPLVTLSRPILSACANPARSRNPPMQKPREMNPRNANPRPENN